jgi:hypothetical protein
MHPIVRAFAEDSQLKRAFVAALRDRAVSAAVIRLQERQATLARISRVSILSDAVVRSMEGEDCALDVLNIDAKRMDDLIAKALAAQSALSDAVAAERKKSGAVPYRVSREILELPDEIAHLETLILRFDAAREQYLDALRDKGVDPRMLVRLEPVPTHEDLAQWQRDSGTKRERLARLRAYDQSGPFYDPTLLGKDLLVSLDF